MTIWVLTLFLAWGAGFMYGAGYVGRHYDPGCERPPEFLRKVFGWKR